MSYFEAGAAQHGDPGLRRRSNPNCPFNHAQANLTTHEQGRRLHDKFFAPGVNNRRFPSPKTKPCEKLKKSLPFAFGQSFFFHSFFFFLHWSHRWRCWSHRLASPIFFFVTLPIFLPRTKLFVPKQSLKTWLFNTPAKTSVSPRADGLRELFGDLISDVERRLTRALFDMNRTLSTMQSTRRRTVTVDYIHRTVFDVALFPKFQREFY